jgi:hypothetical protein
MILNIIVLKFHGFYSGRPAGRSIFIRVYPDLRKSPLKYVDG